MKTNNLLCLILAFAWVGLLPAQNPVKPAPVQKAVQPATIQKPIQQAVPQKSDKGPFPHKIGNLSFSTNALKFNYLKNTETRTDTLKVRNDWNKPITLSFKKGPAYIECKVLSSSLDPGKEGLILCTYDGVKAGDFGNVYGSVELQTNDSVEAVKRFFVMAYIEEDFSKLTPEQVANAPKITFKLEKYNWGTVKEGEKVKYNYEFTNDGKSDLIIRKTKASCGCTATKPSKTTLKPGESSTIETIFDSKGRKGHQQKSVSVVSNDPKNPNVTLFIEGEVSE